MSARLCKMSRRRKHVTQGMDDEVELQEGQSIARVTDCRGGNIFEVHHMGHITSAATAKMPQLISFAFDVLLLPYRPQVALPGGRQTLCMIPQKFNKKLWVRRGGFVVVEESEAAAEDTKVSGNIITVRRVV